MIFVFEDCKHCGKKNLNVEKGFDGEIIREDLCLDCTDRTGRMLTQDESYQTLLRLTNFNDSLVYGGGYMDDWNAMDDIYEDHTNG